VNTFFAGGAVIDVAARANLTPKDRIVFHSKAVEGLLPAFSMKEDLSSVTDPGKHGGTDFFSKSLDFSLQVQNLMHHIERHAMQTVFTILNVEQRILPITGMARLDLRDNNTMNLLKHYSSLDLNTVLLSSEYYAKHSLESIDAENMSWTQELILNSCDDELKHYLMSRLSLLPPEQHGGPTVFMLMVEQIMSNNVHLARALINQLNSFTIPMIAGENIENAAAFIKNVCIRLDTCQKLPPDITDIVYNIMKTCTVDRFKLHMQILESTGSPTLRTYDGVLHEAVDYYTLLHTVINEWLPLTKHNSVYMSNGNNNMSDKI
jgi:hypothetical protein